MVAARGREGTVPGMKPLPSESLSSSPTSPGAVPAAGEVPERPSNSRSHFAARLRLLRGLSFEELDRVDEGGDSPLWVPVTLRPPTQESIRRRRQG